METSTIAWLIGAAVWLSVMTYVLWTIGPVWRDRLTRCPETGSMTLVGFERVGGPAPGCRITRCGLWPAQRNCARGCAWQIAACKAPPRSSAS